MDLTERSVEHLHLQTEWPNAQIDLVLVISGCFTASLSAESGKLLSEVTFCCSNVFFSIKILYCHWHFTRLVGNGWQLYDGL